MFFLVSESIISSLEVKCKGADIVVINLSHAQVVDITGVITLGKIKDSLAQQGVRTIFTGLPEPAYKKMLALGILDGSEEAINRGDKLEAVEYAQALAMVTNFALVRLSMNILKWKMPIELQKLQRRDF